MAALDAFIKPSSVQEIIRHMDKQKTLKITQVRTGHILSIHPVTHPITPPNNTTTYGQTKDLENHPGKDRTHPPTQPLAHSLNTSSDTSSDTLSQHTLSTPPVTHRTITYRSFYHHDRK